MSTRKKTSASSPLEVFGSAVRIERKARGFSQEVFADHVGMDRSDMGGVERGERNIALANIMKIVDGLAMQPSELFKHLDKTTPQRRREI
jgi:transcriptional regulator with XRE-family HTH domain